MRYVFCLLSVLFISACSGRVGSSAGSSVGSYGISGIVSAGPINGATVTAYALNTNGSLGSQLATTTSDPNGKYSLNMAAQNSPVIIIASSGSYVEEASGSTVSMGNAQLRTTLSKTSDGQRVGVTPVTEIATQNTIAAIITNGSASLPSIIDNSNSILSRAMGLTDVTKPPADPTRPASSASSSDSAKYALVLATFSQMAATASVSAGSEVNSLDMAQALATSFTYNGNFTGTVGSGGGAQNVPVPNAGSAMLNLTDVLSAVGGSGASFSAAMQSAMNVYLASPQAVNLGFNDSIQVPPPIFESEPPNSPDAPNLVPPIPPSTLPTVSPIVGGPPSFSPLPSTMVYLNSTQGDFIGQGIKQELIPSIGLFTAQHNAGACNSGNGDCINISFNGGAFNSWSFSFATPVGATMALGQYLGATRYPFNSPVMPGIDITGQSRGCNQSAGSFYILELALNADNSVAKFAADFTQLCDGGTALNGSLRFNSTVPVSAQMPAPAPTPEPAPTPSSMPTAVYLNSTPGDYIGQGVIQQLTPSAGVFTANHNVGDCYNSTFGDCINIAFNGGAFNSWSLTFATPVGASMTDGQYLGATRYPFNSPVVPGIEITGQSRGCNQSAGSFKILGLTLNADNSVASFAADFTQFCDGGPALNGSVRFNSTVPVPAL